MENYVDKIRQGGIVYPIKDVVSGYLSADDHGAVEEGNAGYVTGDDVYQTLGAIEAQLAEL